MRGRAWKVGELARDTGVSVRTLHHYHEIGLLVPSSHTAGSQRLYVQADLERLQRILSLRQLGLPLKEIAAHLDDPSRSTLEAIEAHRRLLEERLDVQRRLSTRLERVARGLRARGAAELDDLLSAIEHTARVEAYFTDDELAFLEERRAEVGEERIARAQEEWRRVFGELGDALRRGSAPDDPELAPVAERARVLMAEFTGGHAGVRRSLGRMYAEEGAEKVLSPHGFDFDPEVYAFLSKVMAAHPEGETR